MRKLPPIIVSCVVAAIVIATAMAAITSQAETRVNAMQEGEAIKPTSRPEVSTIEVQITPSTTPTKEPEQESTYTSMIYSRDWGAEDSVILLKIAMAEAEGESVEGKALVMLVVLNRVWSEDFPDSIEEVVFQPRQFSPVTEGGRYYTTEPDAGCYEALELVMSGWDESYGALYFESCEKDSWHSENLEFLYQVGNHKFYK